MHSMGACSSQGDEMYSDEGEFIAERKCIALAGGSRCWYTYAPPSAANATSPVPLVVDLHGQGGCSTGMARQSGWRQKAASEGFYVAWPQGSTEFAGLTYEASWNAGTCCGGARDFEVDDVRFLTVMVENELERRSNADPTRIYFAGHSNGCMMAQRMAYDMSYYVSAVACFSGYLVIDPEATSIAKPSGFVATSVLFVIGADDTTVPWDASTVAGTTYPGGLRNLDYWQSLNGCSGSADITHGSRFGFPGTSYESTGCTNGTEVQAIEATGVGHQVGLTPFGQDTEALPMLHLAWDFVSGFSKPYVTTPLPRLSSLTSAMIFSFFVVGIIGVALVAALAYVLSVEWRRASYERAPEGAADEKAPGGGTYGEGRTKKGEYHG